jgi:tRNA A-37 threonylcarbamoyl transferase component Bud32
MPSSDPKDRARNILRGLSEHESERSGNAPGPQDPADTRTVAEPFLIGFLAVQQNLIRPEQLDECLKAQNEGRARGVDLPLEEILVERGCLTREALAGLLEERTRRSMGFPNLPRFEIRTRLGEGASAIVYAAWDRELHRRVALKVLRPEIGLGDVARERFRREAQATAGLTHPHVVTVYDAGEADGHFYLVMELVEGRPLGEMLKGGKLPQDEALRLLVKVARGVSAAHQKGIVHRDLKPANLLVTPSGEPKVGDFGLAHLTGDRTELTRTGTTLGTPLYMSPEQVEGRSKEVTPRTDVYALGAILYEILTGRPPHVGEVTMELYRSIVHDSVVSPRRLNPAISPELESIALKALEKEPGRRYPTAGEFAQDLERHLAGEPVQARPPGLLYLALRRLRRHRVVVAMGLVLALAAGVSIQAVRLSRSPGTERETYSKAWRTAMTRAAARDYSGALQQLGDALAGVKDPDLHREALQDLDLLTRIEAAHSDALRLLYAWPAHRNLALEYWDETGAPARIERPLIRSTPYQAELERETRTLTVPFGEILAGALADLLLSQAGQRSKADPLGVAGLLLLEGQAERARRLPGHAVGAIRDKYWIHSKALVPARTASPEAVEKEAAARRLFYSAESDHRQFASRAESAPRYASLLREYADTDFVRRNRGLIESRKNAGSEYFFFFDDLQVGGGFRQRYQPGVEWYWTSARDSDPDRSVESHADLRFSPLPNTRYRCWVYVGGCCLETVTWFAQGTDWVFPDPRTGAPTPMEPGKEASRPIAQTLLSSPPTHAAHGGPRQPSRWGWIEVPLPGYAAPGPKTVRLLSHQPGFSVAYALVSSVRESPLGEPELKKRIREAGSTRARGALWVAAAGPSARFQPPMTQGSLFAEGSLSGALVYADIDNRKVPPQFQSTKVALRADTDEGGSVSYPIEIPKEGEWFLWARLYYPGGGVIFRSGEGLEDDPNSFFLSVDGGKEQVLGNLSYYPQKSQSYFRRWHWDGDSESRKAQEPAPMALGSLGRGSHTLRIRNREAIENATFHLSPRLDMLCLTLDPAYIPRDEDVRQ